MIVRDKGWKQVTEKQRSNQYKSRQGSVSHCKHFGFNSEEDQPENSEQRCKIFRLKFYKEHSVYCVGNTLCGQMQKQLRKKYFTLLGKFWLLLPPHLSCLFLYGPDTQVKKQHYFFFLLASKY